jgi:iron complex transport system substrate-binding protein
VQEGAVYEVPYGPYNWMDRPPSVQRVLAVKWLANLLYPEVFDYDMVAEAQAFYQLFFHYELTQEEARALLANSTLRGG